MKKIQNSRVPTFPGERVEDAREREGQGQRRGGGEAVPRRAVHLRLKRRVQRRYGVARLRQAGRPRPTARGSHSSTFPAQSETFRVT
jgi:hypothetical protein